MISGMELLLQAAGCGGRGSVQSTTGDAGHSSTFTSSSSANGTARHDERIAPSHRSRFAPVESRRSQNDANDSYFCSSSPRRPGASLPPKKRLKLNSGGAAPLAPSFLPVLRSDGAIGSLSHCSGLADAPTVSSERTEPSFRGVVVPGKSFGGGFLVPNIFCAESGKRSAGRATTGRRKQSSSPGVKDVDGNDVGMGYFSTLPSRKEEPRTVTPQGSVGSAAETTPLPRPTSKAAALSKDEAVSESRKMLYRAYLQALNQSVSKETTTTNR